MSGGPFKIGRVWSQYKGAIWTTTYYVILHSIILNANTLDQAYQSSRTANDKVDDLDLDPTKE